jgi:hypothetical protein
LDTIMSDYHKPALSAACHDNFVSRFRALRRSLCLSQSSEKASQPLKLIATGILGLVIGAGAITIAAPITVTAGDDGIYDIANGQGKRPSAVPARYGQLHGQNEKKWSITSIFSRLGPVEAPAERERAPLQLRADSDKSPPKRPKIAIAKAAPYRDVSAPATFNKRRSVCVRMCDGYTFPIGDLTDSKDSSAHEAICQATCPSAPVKLFTLAPNEDNIEKAVSLDNKPYKSLPMAFAHQRTSDQACTCHGGASHSARVSMLKDFTLRAGDTVVLDGKAKVFNGAKSFPYSAKDFSDLRSTKSLTRTARRQVNELVGYTRRAEIRKNQKQSFRAKEARMPFTYPAGMVDTSIETANGIRVVTISNASMR